MHISTCIASKQQRMDSHTQASIVRHQTNSQFKDECMDIVDIISTLHTQKNTITDQIEFPPACIDCFYAIASILD